MRNLLPLLQVLLVVTVLIWNIVLTGRIVQVRQLPRAFVALTALAGFLVLPSLVIHLATTNAIFALVTDAVILGGLLVAHWPSSELAGS